MRSYLLACSLVVVLGGCKHSAENTTATPNATEEQGAISITAWTGKTELFMEYPPLAAGTKSRFAVHVTRLDSFRPVQSGRLEVRLRSGNGASEVFSIDAPSRPGIFGIDVAPKIPGTYDMSVTLKSATLSDTHNLGQATVYPDPKSAKAQPASAEEATRFLKEQQWTLDFATAVVENRVIRQSILVPGEIEARSGGIAELTAPFLGRVISANVPAPGTLVRSGDVLARLLPPLDNPSDVAAVELEKAQAETLLQLSRRDRDRAERLLKAGAVPGKRLEEAQAAERSAEARLRAAEQRLQQYESARSASADAQSSRAFLLRAPITGVIAETHIAPGANVEAGETLARIVDVRMAYAKAHVAEAHLPRLRHLTGAELLAPGLPAARTLGRPLSVGRIVDPASRTVDVVYLLNNSSGQLAVGQAVEIRLFTSDRVKGPAIPESAVVDDAGRPIVFVQVGGEAFARRPVRLGSSEREYIQVMEGVKAGDRVVTKGANFVRLASMSSQVPAHGHVH